MGAVDKAAIIDGSTIAAGDHIYALPSSGCHSNGYSLIRKILNNTALKNEPNIIDTLLEPTTIYVKAISDLKNKYPIKGIANITGGGLAENLQRILPTSVSAHIAKEKIKVPSIFNLLQKYGNVDEQEMYRVFNMGVGMIVISEADINDHDCYRIGTIKKGNHEVIL